MAKKPISIQLNIRLHWFKIEGKLSYRTTFSNLSIQETEPEVNKVRSYITIVGKPWGWDTRPQYATNKSIIAILDEPDCRLFLFRKNDQIIGHSLVNKEKIKDQFITSNKVARIETFGLFPEETGKGYGSYFLANTFATLIDNYDYVYLTSRSTNHSSVLSFYLKNGMKIIRTQEKDNDPVLDPEPFHISLDE